MKIIFRQPQLYRFLNYCNESDLEKTILDCGAGGACPPLALFLENGYKTYGIELRDSQIEKATQFSLEHHIALNIQKGDIRLLPYGNESMSFVFSYNTIFHMKKPDILQAIGEIKRVLKPGGICLLNFLSVHDEDYGSGKPVGKDAFQQMERGEEVIHAYFEDDEADRYFQDMKILFKENRVLERIYEGNLIKQGYIDYIAQKPLEKRE